ncbi:MAG: hypothetical protein FJY07_14825 [Bacteroidetes bacterium]|nr:hypothetical protein [Bacteroidota bacterium]
MSTGTLKLSLTYEQIVSLIRQLPSKERVMLGKELAKDVLDERLSRLLGTFKTNKISEELIRQETEIVRAKLYAGKKGK